MRIHFKTTPNTEKVGFNYQQKMVGRLHKWLGLNDLHDSLSLYSISWLNGGNINEDKSGLNFRSGASFFISFHDEDKAKKIVDSGLKDIEIFAGMKVNEIQIQMNPEFKRKSYSFFAVSPILVKKQTEQGIEFLDFRNPEASEIISRVLDKKLKAADIEHNGFNLNFEGLYSKAKTKLVNYRNINNKANICPVKIAAEPHVMQFAWNVGIGHSTGSAFGAVK